MSEHTAVGPRIGQWRGLWGWSQRELARRADIANGALSQIELGNSSPSIHTLQKIAKALGLTLEALLFGTVRLPCVAAEKSVAGAVVTYDFSPMEPSFFKRVSVPAATSLEWFEVFASDGGIPACRLYVEQGELALSIAGKEFRLACHDACQLLPGTPFKLSAIGCIAQCLVFSV